MGDAFRSGVGIAGGYGLLKLFGLSVFLRLLTFLYHDLIRTCIQVCYACLSCDVFASQGQHRHALEFRLGLAEDHANVLPIAQHIRQGSSYGRCVHDGVPLSST